MDFTPYPKTPRLKRNIVITEKIDGTNAQVVFTQHLLIDFSAQDSEVACTIVNGPDTYLEMRVGSRNRWITPGKATDNFGFAGWCVTNAQELSKMGPGQHFGEWYGQGIGRGYGLAERRFALFNSARWGAHNPNTPTCCEVVPVLHLGDMVDVDQVMTSLKLLGSVAVPGFMKPEGLIVYHSAAQATFKVLAENDEMSKGQAEHESRGTPVLA